jgi:cytochrome P450
MTDTVGSVLSDSSSARPSPFTAVLDGERHAIYAELNAGGPVHPTTTPTGVPAWLVTGYAEARALLADPRLGAAGCTFGSFFCKKNA